MNIQQGTSDVEVNGWKFLALAFSFLILFLSPFLVSAQKQQSIKIDHATILLHDNNVANGAQRLIGNVIIEDDSVIMYCDSAYVYSNNSFWAYNHVHLKRHDTINLYGDSLHYDGNTKRAQMFGKITYTQSAMKLTTLHLIYSVDSAFIHYWGGGTLVDSNTTLTSELGTYNSKAQMASFKGNVLLVSPDYTVHCDTMDYSPSLHTSYFYGPTHISTKDNYMYCERGYYNTSTGISQFSQHAYITGKNGELLSGDQIYYDRKNDYGQLLDNVSMTDTTDNITIDGDYAYYNGASRTMMVTCNALMMQKYDQDTLFLHADTLFAHNISVNDTTKGEKGPPKTMLAYHHVRIFKKDLQGKCDSLSYVEKDSVMHMLYSPILWSDINQLTADTINIYLKNKKIDKMDMLHNAFIISRDTLASKEDSLQFNQIKGRDMRAYFVKNSIHRVDVKGNAQTVYYVYADNNKKIVGANRADCSSMLIYIQDNKVKSITFQDKPDATLFPMKDVKPQDFLLKNFAWREDERPKKLLDIFK